ncbi:MAG TPA: acyltransferase [Ktedonobacterales bacterium]|nr:acyltransferase [Ktedonobacterales bacterium]
MPVSRQIGFWLAAQLEENKPKGVIASLDGVRACACLTVMGYHISLMTRDMHLWSVSDNPLVSAVLLAGGAGVTLFFVLSGFLLFLPYVKALLFSQPWPGTRMFYLRRVLRIIPGYYFSLIVIVLLAQPGYLEPQHWQELLLFPLFLMDSTRATFQQLNGPYWTLAVEWQFYMLLPLIALGIRCVAQRVPPEKRSWAVMGCLLGLMGWGLLTRAVGGYLMDNPTATFLIPRSALNVVLFFTYGTSGKYLEDFAVGMLAGLAYTLWRDQAVGAKVGQMLRRLSPWLLTGGLVLLLFMAMQHYSLEFQYNWPVASALFQLPGWLNEVGFALGFGAGMMAILFGPAWLNGVFAWPLLRWIGLISYSLYIWHLPLLGAFFHHIAPSLLTLPAAVTYSLYWVWAVVIVIPFSFVLYVLIEKPGMRLSSRLRSQMAMQWRPEPAAKQLVEV